MHQLKHRKHQSESKSKTQLYLSIRNPLSSKILKDLKVMDREIYMHRETQYVIMSVLLNLIYRLSTIQIKIPTSYFVYTDREIIKLIWTGKNTQNS